MNRAKAIMVAIGATLLVGSTATPASAGITIYQYLGYSGNSRYYDYNDCNYVDNGFEAGALSAVSYSSSSQTYYFYWGVAQKCLDRDPTGWEKRLFPGQSFSGTTVHGHFKS